MSKDDGNSIFDELDSRLDDFFADDDIAEDESTDMFSNELVVDLSETSNMKDPAPNAPVSKQKINSNNGPLDSLKVIVLEMDWELNDENLNKYLDEIERLKILFKDDRAIYLFFKLHSSIGKYMLYKKASADPDALKFLYQVFNNLEKVILKNYTTLEKNKMILTEVANFKNLKARMFPDNYTSVDVKSFTHKQTVKPVKPDFSSLPYDIQKEINNYIEREISQKIESLKKELKKP